MNMNKRNKDARLVGLLGIIGNIFLFSIKITIGIITKSRAMIADAANSGSDTFNSILTIIGNKVSAKSRDDDHNLGHGKAEYIYSLLISITMILLGIKVFLDSLKGLINNTIYTYNIWLIIICLITIITKLIMYKITDKIGKKHNNLLVMANAKDHRNDCFITSITLVSVICSYYNIRYIDCLVGIGISLWIIYTGIEIFIKSYDVLMDKTCSNEVKEEVLKIVKRHEEIDHITHFNATPVGYRYQVSFSIFVDGNLSTFDSHDIANNLEKEIDKEVEEIYLTVIHVNPIKKNNKKCDKII